MARTETVCLAGAHTCSGRCRGCQRGLGPSLPSRRASRPLTLRSALRAQGSPRPLLPSCSLPPRMQRDTYVSVLMTQRASCEFPAQGPSQATESAYAHPNAERPPLPMRHSPAALPGSALASRASTCAVWKTRPVLPPSLWGSEQIQTPRGKPCSERLRTGLRKRTALGSSRSPDEHPL